MAVMILQGWGRVVRRSVNPFVTMVMGLGLGLLQASDALAADASCRLRHPIVLSHHWGVRAICPDPALTGPRACAEVEDYERLCAVKGVDAKGRRSCGEWRVPDEDADLPPRDTNRFDPSLKRSLRGYHRYFSRAIVERLSGVCGNQVYIADKPIYGSYEERARAMRNTVMQALAETGADKVVLIGLSQGAQDARFLAGAMPVDDHDPAKGRMADKVAAVVSIAGEDQGAASADIQLDVMFLSNGGDWTDPSRTGGLWRDEASKKLFWTREVDGRKRHVLSEDCRGADCDLATPRQRYAWGLHSLAILSTRYMRPSLLQKTFTLGWGGIRAATGMKHDHWEAALPRAAEASHGVKYYSYAMAIQRFRDSWDRPELHYALLLSGRNDGYVTVASQMLDQPAPAFEHIKTLSGSPEGSGYHHNFATGRNDRLYQPLPAHREAPPYDGDAAGFYQQIARDLRQRGH